MKTFNKRGDRGETSLLYGSRVSKCHPRCEAYGTIDEVVSALGLARSLCTRVKKDVLLDLQRKLFVAGAELATPQEQYEKALLKGSIISSAMVDALEKQIDELEASMEMPRAFVVPGAAAGAAAIDLARSMLRRAERRTVELFESGEVKNEELLKFLNRMADLLFTLARYEEGEQRLYV